MVPDRLLVGERYGLSLGEATRGFLISMQAPGRYSQKYLDDLAFTLSLLNDYALGRDWPPTVDVTTSHVEEFLLALRKRDALFPRLKKKLAASTIETHYRRLKRFFGWLVERDYIDRNPVDLIPHPKIPERVTPAFSEREALAMFELTNPRHARTDDERFRAVRDTAVLMILFDTPARRGELTGLRLGDVDLDEGFIRVVGKGDKERAMPISAVTREGLWAYFQVRAEREPKTDALWTNVVGEAMHPDWVYRFLRRLGKRANIDRVFTHRFRHNFANKWLRSQGGERTLEVLGGWSRIPATYTRSVDAFVAREIHRRISPMASLAETQGVRRGRPPKRA